MHPSKTLDWKLVKSQVSSSSYLGEEPIDPFWFGDSAQLSEELNALVISGRKSATASLLWEWEFEDETLPSIGQHDVLLSWSNVLVGVIRTTAICVLPFQEVTAEFAALEGEGDLSLKFWREAHWSFFGNVCNCIGREPSMDMSVVCQEFKLEYFHDAP